VLREDGPNLNPHPNGRPYYARVTDVDMRAVTPLMSMYKPGPDGKALQWENKSDWQTEMEACHDSGLSADLESRAIHQCQACTFKEMRRLETDGGVTGGGLGMSHF